MLSAISPKSTVKDMIHHDGCGILMHFDHSPEAYQTSLQGSSRLVAWLFVQADLEHQDWAAAQFPPEEEQVRMVYIKLPALGFLYISIGKMNED